MMKQYEIRFYNYDFLNNNPTLSKYLINIEYNMEYKIDNINILINYGI